MPGQSGTILLYAYILAMAVVVAIGAFAIDRVLLALEDRGVLFYRRSRLTPRSFGNALLGPFTLVDPAKRHVIEQQMKQELRRETEDEGAPPTGGR